MVYYDQIHLYYKDLYHGKNKSLMNDMNEISKDIGYDVLFCNNDEILPVKEMSNTDMQRIERDI